MTAFFVSRSGARALIILSICYGAVIGVLGALRPSAIGPFALLGATVLGVAWAVRSVLAKRPDQP